MINNLRSQELAKKAQLQREGAEAEKTSHKKFFAAALVLGVVLLGVIVLASSLTATADQKTVNNSIGMEFVLIPAGEFDMGSPESEPSWLNDERPIHRVKIAKTFYMGKYEVMQKQWLEIMGVNPSSFKGDNLPVESVSWNDVQEFIKRLNEKEGTDKYRLPSEAEWEYAARAGTTTRYSFGDDESKLGDYAWNDANSGSKTHEVGQKKPNPWGLYDMHGNVWEWVQDAWHDDYNGAPTDGSAWEGDSSHRRVVRGGGWILWYRCCRSAARSGGREGDRDGFFLNGRRDVTFGFRLVSDSLPTTNESAATPRLTTALTSIESEKNLPTIAGIGAIILLGIFAISRLKLKAKGEKEKIASNPTAPFPAEQKPKAQEPEPSISYISLERTIYDPVKRDFIVSSPRPLPNVKNWIEKNDPSMYWFVICVNNNSEKPIDEWGIELETPATLTILDARIEGAEQAFDVTKSTSKPWLARWILGVPHHLAVVIPRKGSKRIYFKLGSDACGVDYSIKGKVSTSDFEIPIKEQDFKYSCDAATLKVAIRTNPEEAEKYTQAILSNAYSKGTALKLLQSFRIVREIDSCCAHGDYGGIIDKLHLLTDTLESAKAGERLIRMVRDDLESVSIMGETDASVQRAAKLCGNLVDLWINEILRT